MKGLEAILTAVPGESVLGRARVRPSSHGGAQVVPNPLAWCSPQTHPRARCRQPGTELILAAEAEAG